MKTGVQGTYNWWKELDSGFRRNDGKTHSLTFYEIIKFDGLIKSQDFLILSFPRKRESIPPKAGLLSQE